MQVNPLTSVMAEEGVMRSYPSLFKFWKLKDSGRGGVLVLGFGLTDECAKFQGKELNLWPNSHPCSISVGHQTKSEDLDVGKGFVGIEGS